MSPGNYLQNIAFNKKKIKGHAIIQNKTVLNQSNKQKQSQTRDLNHLKQI